MDPKPLLKDASASSAEEFLDSIIENIPNMIFVKEARELRFVRFNHAGEELLGYSRQELIGKNDYDFFPREEADFFVSRDRAVLESGVLLEIPEEPIHTRHKGKRLLRTKKIPILGANGKPAYLLGISEDITDRKRIEQAEAELYRSRNLEGIGRLAGGIAHDFNNLLTGILGIVSEVQSDPELPPQFRDDFDEILRSGQRAAGLTRQLLAFGRRQMSTPQVLQVNDEVRDLRPLLDRLLAPKCRLDCQLAPDLAACRMDPGQLEQVLLNIILNARDAMPRGGDVRLKTANRRLASHEIVQCPDLLAGDYVELTIADAGVGMDEETRLRAFEPFYTTKPKDKGTGLGLSTAYGIVKQNGGDIALTSVPGQGTQVSLWLPRIETVAPGAVAQRPASDRRGHETILVAEDESLVRRTVVRTLIRAGYTVLEAKDGEEALLRGKENVVDLLLTDILMPGINGREVAASLAKEKPGLRVVYMSGYAEDIVALREVLHQNIAFLEKTFTSDVLLAKVREVLDQPDPPLTLQVHR